MRNLIIFFLAIGLAFGGCKPQPQQPRDDGAITQPADDASVQDAATSLQDASVQYAYVPVQDATTSKAGVSSLAAYLSQSMMTWRKGDSVFYDAIAVDIAVVVSAESEPPVFTHDDARGETGILMATLAFFEGGLQKWVDATFEGGCNDTVWRASKTGRATMAGVGDCDGGNAISLWQVHVEHTLALLPDGGWRAAAGDDLADGGPPDGVDLIRPRDLRDRRVAVRVALHMARESVFVTGSLCHYSGEGAFGGGCPKAKARLDFARNWWQHHPL